MAAMRMKTVAVAVLLRVLCVQSYVQSSMISGNGKGPGLAADTYQDAVNLNTLTQHTGRMDGGREGKQYTSLLFAPESKSAPSTGNIFWSPEAHARAPAARLDTDKMSCVTGSTCGDGFCCCYNKTADCRGQGLSYIPQLPSQVVYLDFSQNSLKDMNITTLQNVSSLEGLKLDENNISSVHQDSFSKMRDLKELYLNKNNLSDSDALLTALKPAKSLTILSVDDNSLSSMNMTVLLDFPNLRNLSLYNNYITLLEVPADGQAELENLVIGANLLQDFPRFCQSGQLGEVRSRNRSYLPKLTTLNIEWNRIDNMPPDAHICLPYLTHLNMEGNSIYHVQRNFLQVFPKLKELSIRFCMSRIIDSHAFNHSTIQHLDVSENLWFFDKVHGRWIDPGLFENMPQLKSINMSWTVFRYSEPPERDRVLSSLSHVETFSLEGTGLSFIPRTILTSFTNLRHLSFSKNEITFLPDDSFENLTSLRVLDLSKNHLTTFTQRLLEGMVLRDNVKFDLSGNPFSCTCDLLWFIQLFQKNARKTSGNIFIDTYGYVCSNPDDQKGNPLKDVTITDQKCAFSYETYLGVLFVSVFAIILLIVVSLVYRFRWRLRFLMYTLQHRLTRDKPRGEAPPPRYDVFVSYDSKDTRWVLKQLQKELEDRRGLRLCLHERDFTPGRFISDNILEKMQESSAILPVLSNSFLHSDWCRFELFVAVKSGLARAQRRVPVVPILLESLDKTAVDSLVSVLLNTTTYLAWPQGGGSEERGAEEGERSRERRRFWNALCEVLAKSTGRNLR